MFIDGLMAVLKIKGNLAHDFNANTFIWDNKENNIKNMVLKGPYGA